MNAVVLAAIGLIAVFAGYRFYSTFISEKIYRLDPDFKTPAHTMRDDIDYVPTNRVVLWGHHFTAVAGAAPIIGPSIAVVWGWLPAFLWVVIGTMFFAGVHDFGAIWASVRNKALSVGSLTGEVVSHRARNLFMIVVFFLLLMVNAVFAVAIAGGVHQHAGLRHPGLERHRRRRRHRGAALQGGRRHHVADGRRHGHPVRGHRARRGRPGSPARDVPRPRPGGAVDTDSLRLRRGRLDAPGLAAAPAARLHQRHPALRRPRHPVRRRAHRRPDRRCTRDQPRPATRDAAHHAVALRHHRLRRHLRLPWSGQLRHHVQAARHGA